MADRSIRFSVGVGILIRLALKLKKKLILPSTSHSMICSCLAAALILTDYSGGWKVCSGAQLCCYRSTAVYSRMSRSSK